MQPILTRRNSLHGAIIYASGDSCAALLTGEFQFSRLIGMILLGGTLYAIEIPGYFAWIERRLNKQGLSNSIKRALLAEAYFNPLWIARHIAFINCFSGQFAALHWNLIEMGVESFIHILPLALLANYLIQNLVPLIWRFFVSAIFSALMAIYYALSEVLFG